MDGVSFFDFNVMRSASLTGTVLLAHRVFGGETVESCITSLWLE